MELCTKEMLLRTDQEKALGTYHSQLPVWNWGLNQGLGLGFQAKECAGSG